MCSSDLADRKLSGPRITATEAELIDAADLINEAVKSDYDHEMVNRVAKKHSLSPFQHHALHAIAQHGENAGALEDDSDLEPDAKALKKDKVHDVASLSKSLGDTDEHHKNHVIAHAKKFTGTAMHAHPKSKKYWADAE